VALTPPRLAYHQANEKALQVKALEGELVPADQVRGMLEQVITNARAKLLGLPTRAAQAAIAATGLHQIENDIRDIVYEALDELAAGYDAPENGKSNKG